EGYTKGLGNAGVCRVKKDKEFLAVCGIPYSGRSISADGGHPFAIGAERHVPDLLTVTGERAASSSLPSEETNVHIRVEAKVHPVFFCQCVAPFEHCWPGCRPGLKSEIGLESGKIKLCPDRHHCLCALQPGAKSVVCNLCHNSQFH